MAWVERLDRRGRRRKVFQDDANPQKFAIDATLAPLHYESVPDSGNYDAEIDFTPEHITDNGDYWRVTQNGWHYALGQPPGKATDGWVGFGGRQGAHWLLSRLVRVGYIRWNQRSWTDVGGAPTYNRANLSQTAGTVGTTVGSVIAENEVEWRNIWATQNGGELWAKWRVHGDGLKEELRINQAGRDALTNAYPGGPTSQFYLAFVFQLDASDIPRWVKDGILQDVNGDFDDDDGTTTIELQDASERLLGFLPIDSAWVEDGTGEMIDGSKVTLRKRIYTEGGTPYLLVGLRVDIANALPTGTLVFDPTIDATVGASLDDGSEDTGGIVYANETATGYLNGVGWQIMARWNVTIPTGATIDAAYQEWYNYAQDDPDLDVYGDDVANSLELDDAEIGVGDSGQDITSRTLTTATVNWSQTNAGGGYIGSGTSLVSIIQELVDTYDYSSGAYIGIISYARGSCAVRFYTYDAGVSNAPKLHIEYTESSGAATITVSTLTLASTPQASTVVPGAVSIAASTLTLASTPQASTVVPGAVSIAASTLTITGSAQAATIVPGAVTVNVNTVTLAAGIQTITIVSSVTVALDTLTLASAPQVMDVVPGAVTIAAGTLTLTGTPQPTTVVPGAATVSLATITLTAGIQAATVLSSVTIALSTLTLATSATAMAIVPGAIAIAAGTVTLASAPQAMTIVPGAVTVTAGTVTLTSAPQTATVVSGAAIVAMNTLTLASDVQVATVIPGAIAVTAGTVTLTSAPQAMTVIPGAIAIAAGTLTMAGSAQAMTVIPGAVTVAAGTVTLASTTIAITITAGAIVSASSLILASTAVSSSVVPGPVAVSASTLTIAGSAVAITITSSVTVSASTLTLATSAQAMTIVPGAITIVAGTTTMVAAAQAMSLIPGAVAIATSTLTLATSATAMAIVPGAATVSLNSLTLAGTAGTMVVSIDLGVIVAMQTLTMAASPQAIAFVPGATTVGLNTVTLTSSAVVIVLGALAAAPPRFRAFVGKEDRTAEVKKEDRTAHVGKAGTAGVSERN